MVALKGDKQIGYKINKIIGKLGGGKEMQRIIAKVQELMSLCDRLETEFCVWCRGRESNPHVLAHNGF